MGWWDQPTSLYMCIYKSVDVLWLGQAAGCRGQSAEARPESKRCPDAPGAKWDYTPAHLAARSRAFSMKFGSYQR